MMNKDLQQQEADLRKRIDDHKQGTSLFLTLASIVIAMAVCGVILYNLIG